MENFLKMKDELKQMIDEADTLAGAYGEPPQQLSAAIVELDNKIEEKEIEEGKPSPE